MVCKIIPACLNFRGTVTANWLLSACQSAIFGNIGRNYRNLAGTILHHSVEVRSGSGAGAGLSAFLHILFQIRIQENGIITHLQPALAEGGREKMRSLCRSRLYLTRCVCRARDGDIFHTAPPEEGEVPRGGITAIWLKLFGSLLKNRSVFF